MAARCLLCLKTTRNKKQRLFDVTSDSEVKIRFGYRVCHKKDLNNSLLNTTIHEKCYRRYYDRWYNRCVRKNKVIDISNDFEHEFTSINNENNPLDMSRSSDIHNFDNGADNCGDDSEIDVDDIEIEDDTDETLEGFCSTTALPNQSISQEKKSVLHDISNIDYPVHVARICNHNDENFSRTDFLLHDVNDENNNIYDNSLLQSNTNCELDDVIAGNRKTDHDVTPLENLHINCDTGVVQNVGEYQITIASGVVDEASSFLDSSEVCTSNDQQTTTSITRSRSRFMYPTSTPKVQHNKIETETRRRRQSEEGIVHTTGANDRILIYDSPLNELQAWLTSTLQDGRLIPLIEAQQRYTDIAKSYNHHNQHIHSDIRCDVLRKQLESQFPDQYHFETVNKRDGTYIALNNISHYSRTAIYLNKSSTFDSSDHQQSTTTISDLSKENQTDECQLIFNAVRLLRNHMKDTLHILESLFKEPEKMSELTNDLFVDSVPVIIRNFIGLLTSSNRQFKKLEADYHYYEVFTKDLFQNNPKSLKNVVIGYDILNARHDHVVSPKHILLANEICKHGRSHELLSVFNRFGHAASYKTISRLHRKVADNQMMNSSLPAGVLSDCYMVQVADNFDLNRETLHGERSYHFLNRILVQTPENNYTSHTNNNNNSEISDDNQTQDSMMTIDVVKITDNNNELCDEAAPCVDEVAPCVDEAASCVDEAASCVDEAPPSVDVTGENSDELEQVRTLQSSSRVHERLNTLTTAQHEDHTSISNIRSVDEALRDHSLTYYLDYQPFTDESLALHLLAYGLIKALCNCSGDRSIPLYSGFMAIHLPHLNRSRHKVTFLPPINQDPNKLETAEACITEIKKVLIDSGLQNDAVLVVDERIYRLCVQIRDENWSNFQNIFLYPGDFHLMKCSMIVIWGVLEDSGIDTLIGYLYKGATHRAVLSVAHFNKSLRTIKLLYTALLIILYNEYIKTLSATIIDEVEQLMYLKPTDLTNIEQHRKWYSSVLDYLSNSNWQNGFDLWIKANSENNLKFRFWTFVLFDLITPLIKLYTALRTSNFPARNAAVCELAELFFATNHRQYARLTARHLSDLRVSPQHLIDYISKSFSVCRTNRNFSCIALDQTIEVTINKMGKGHGGITGRCTTELIDVWTNSYTFRSLLSTITCELAGIESNFNSVESHIECSPSRIEADHVDLQIILDKLSDEKLFSLDTNNVTQLFTGKIIHPDIIESNCQCRKIGGEALKMFIHERLVNCSTPLDKALHASSLLRIRDNDTYETTRSSERKSSKKKSPLDIKKIDAEIRRVLLLAQYRSFDLVSVFAHEFSSTPISLCSLEDTNLLNQQSKSKDTFDFLKEKFPLGIYTARLPTLNQQKALIIDGSSLLHIYPSAGSSVFEYSVYLLVEHILPLFNNYDRVDIIFDSSKSQDLKAFIHRHGGKNIVRPKYDIIPRNSLLQTGKAYQNFVVLNRARFAAAVTECWKETHCIQKLPLGVVFVVAGPDETATKLEKDKQPIDIIELETNQIEADSRVILHINQLTQDSFLNIVVKSIDTDVIILCIYYASLCGVQQLFVDATIPKKPPKIIDCTYINDKLIDKYGVNPLIFLIVYALSGCDTCSFIRNVSKRTFMQTLFDAPNDFTDLEKLTILPTNKDDIVGAEAMFVRCFSRSNRRQQQPSTSTTSVTILPQEIEKDLTLNKLRATMAMKALQQNKTSIASSLPPTQDSLYYHCLRVYRQVQIWLQAPDGYIKYPDLEESGFQIVEGRLQVKWMNMSPFSNDPQLLCCGKHKGNCIRCVCIVNKLPCTIFCQCPIDCVNRKSSQITTPTSQIIKKPTKRPNLSRNSTFTLLSFDDKSSAEEETSDTSSSTGNYLDHEIDEISSSQSDLEE